MSGISGGLEERVAALEAGMERLLLHLNLEPAFIRDCRVDVFHGGGTSYRLTHLPTGIKVHAPTKAEAASLLAAELEKRSGTGSMYGIRPHIDQSPEELALKKAEGERLLREGPRWLQPGEG
jgi:hypothetical protein